MNKTKPFLPFHYFCLKHTFPQIAFDDAFFENDAVKYCQRTKDHYVKIAYYSQALSHAVFFKQGSVPLNLTADKKPDYPNSTSDLHQQFELELDPNKPYTVINYCNFISDVLKDDFTLQTSKFNSPDFAISLPTFCLILSRNKYLPISLLYHLIERSYPSQVSAYFYAYRQARYREPLLLIFDKITDYALDSSCLEARKITARVSKSNKKVLSEKLIASLGKRDLIGNPNLIGIYNLTPLFCDESYIYQFAKLIHDQINESHSSIAIINTISTIANIIEPYRYQLPRTDYPDFYHVLQIINDALLSVNGRYNDFSAADLYAIDRASCFIQRSHVKFRPTDYIKHGFKITPNISCSTFLRYCLDRHPFMIETQLFEKRSKESPKILALFRDCYDSKEIESYVADLTRTFITPNVISRLNAVDNQQLIIAHRFIKRATKQKFGIVDLATHDNQLALTCAFIAQKNPNQTIQTKHVTKMKRLLSSNNNDLIDACTKFRQSTFR
ncbi:hypothetical protein [Photobacterium leiognathi]|uniref:hypothetical protein n=1 Tax=Photobacterium leiognathi TaxID=553611 RepID=UPI002981EC22|nr:hypothetical protein [Photobacterium leiognathi]